MDREEILITIQETWDYDEIVTMLVKYGICDEEDIIEALADYVVELEEYLIIENNDD